MKKNAVLAALWGILLLMGSCQAPWNSRENGTLTLKVSLSQGGRGRTVVPDLAGAVASYRLELTSQEGFESREASSVSDQVTVENLPAGTWDIKGQALDAQGTVLAEMTLTGRDLTAADTLELTLALEPTVRTGTGSLDLSLSWPEASGVDGLTVSLEDKDGAAVSGTAPEVTLEPPVAGSPRTGRIIRADLSAGTYVLVLEFTRSGTAAGTFREAVNISADLTARLWINPADGKLETSRTFTAADFLGAQISLSALTVPEVLPGDFTFDPDDTGYTIPQVPRHQSITFTPEEALPGQKIEYEWNGSAARGIPSGETSRPLPLQAGENELTLLVTAPDRTSSRTYTLTFHWTPFYVSPTGMEMVQVEGGSFQRDATAVNLSTVSNFLMGKFEVTQTQWEAVMGYNPSNFSGLPGNPVEQVTWYDALEFCNKLSEREGLTPVYSLTSVVKVGMSITSAEVVLNLKAEGYRLPTESEWSWAARGGSLSSGTSKRFAGDNGTNSIDDYAWHYKNIGAVTTREAGTKLPNELAIYDLSGNVFEWCWDRGHSPEPPLPQGPLKNFLGMDGASVAVNRTFTGGAWILVPENFQDLKVRNFSDRISAYQTIGFRVARNTEPLYKVTYAATGAEEDKSFSEAYKAGETVNLLRNAAGLSRSRAILLGWTSSSGGIGGTVYSFGETFTMPSADVTLTPVWLDMITVARGTFQRDAAAANLSTVSDFELGKYEVTREQFDAVMGSDPSDTKYSNPPNRKEPVQMVSLYTAMAFSNKLSLLAGLSPVYSVSGITDWGTLTLADIPKVNDANWNAVQIDSASTGYRLPREMEFMWASMGGYSDKITANIVAQVNRGGYQKSWSGSDGTNTLADADLNMWSSRTAGGKLRTVGSLNANELGFHDMSGNVWELCQDWNADFPAGAVQNYLGPQTPSSSVILKGGSLWHHPYTGPYGSPGYRGIQYPYEQKDDAGFRIARSTVSQMKLTYSDSGAESGILVAEAHRAGEDVTVLENAAGLQKFTYGVSAWTTGPGGTGTVYLPGDLFTMPSKDLTLYPKWSVATVSVPGGTFLQTASFSHTLSPYWLGKYEVTYEQWYNVRQWASAPGKGYSIGLSGREGHDGTVGAAPTSAGYEPATMMNWRDALVWCNALSEMEGLTPVYYTDAALTVPLRTSTVASPADVAQGSQDNPYVRWDAEGYRLPTEGEMSFAAGYKDGSNWTPYNYASGAAADVTNGVETGKVAWYSVNSGGTTKVVGTKLPNALGFYDLSGNVWEYLWDAPESLPLSPRTDYRGGSFSNYRSIYGGAYDQSGGNVAIGHRQTRNPYEEQVHLGFRIARSKIRP